MSRIYSAWQVIINDSTVTVVQLPSEDMKGALSGAKDETLELSSKQPVLTLLLMILQKLSLSRVSIRSKERSQK